jgi:hypothetical protein
VVQRTLGPVTFVGWVGRSEKKKQEKYKGKNNRIITLHQLYEELKDECCKDKVGATNMDDNIMLAYYKLIVPNAYQLKKIKACLKYLMATKKKRDLSPTGTTLSKYSSSKQEAVENGLPHHLMIYLETADILLHS